MSRLKRPRAIECPQQQTYTLLAAHLPHLHRVPKKGIRTWCRKITKNTHTRIALSDAAEGHVALHVAFAAAKSRIAVSEPSNHGLSLTLSGNHPLVPPTARSMIR